MTQWGTEELYTDSTGYFLAIENAIAQAHSSIEIESYIFDLSSRALRLIQLLIAANARGVAVRVSVDGFGTAPHCAELRSMLLNTSIQLRIFHPLLTVGLLRLIHTFNRRNHRKMWIFDRKTVFVGSANIQTNDWIELGLSVTGSETASLIEAFDRAWSPAHQRLKEFTKRLFLSTRAPAFTLLNDSLLTRRRTYRHLCHQIRIAKKTVCIANAYFAPRFKFLRLITQARKRGVDVTLLVPARSDVFFMPWLTRAYYALLIAADVKVYEHPAPFLHAKVCIADDWMTVGSTNLNHRSLLHDLEVDLIVTKPINQSRLRDRLVELVQESRQKTQKDLDSRTCFDRVLYRSFFKLRRFL
jgi:cardiolipin synthase A/B